jgi:hypothetical protein
MTCSRLEETSALFDGELDALQAETARAHVPTCAECTHFEADLRHLRTSLRDLSATNAVAATPWWRRRIAIPLPVLANLVLAVVILAAVLLVRAPRTAVAPRATSFEDFDAGRPPVVYVRPRSAP